MLAHRAVWLVTNGPIPAGLFVCHHCDNPGCVRPDHLFLGTATDNMRDMHSKNRWRQGRPVPSHLMPRGEAHGRAKLTTAKVIEIRRRKQAGETHMALAVAFGVCLNSVKKLVHRQTWGHVP